MYIHVHVQFVHLRLCIPCQVMEHAKKLVSCVVGVFNESKLAGAASLECLSEVETAVLSYLCDDRLLKLQEVAQLNRAFNYLMYRICENCDKTALFGYERGREGGGREGEKYGGREREIWRERERERKVKLSVYYYFPALYFVCY